MDRVVLAGGTESLSTSPASMKRDAERRVPKPWMSEPNPRHPGGARVRHAVHGRGEHRAGDGPHPPRTSTSGRSTRRAGAIASIDTGCVRRRDRAGDRARPDGEQPSSRSTSPAPRGHRRVARRAAGPASRARRRDRHGRQLGRAQRRCRRGRAGERRLRRTRTGSRRWRASGRGRRSASSRRSPGMAPDAGDPEGARPRRDDASPTSTCSRSTRRSARCRSRPSASSASRRRS